MAFVFPPAPERGIGSGMAPGGIYGAQDVQAALERAPWQMPSGLALLLLTTLFLLA